VIKIKTYKIIIPTKKFKVKKKTGIVGSKNKHTRPKRAKKNEKK